MKQFEFIKNKKYFFGFSIALFVFFAIMLIINGIAMDINYKGGTRMTIEATEGIDPNAVGSLIASELNKEVTASVMKSYDSEANNLSITMIRIDIAGNQPLTAEEEDRVKEVLSSNFDVKLDSNKNEVMSISPIIGQETLEQGLWAVVISSGLILLYVAWRFSIISGFSAAVCAIIALIHDIGVMFGVYITFKMPLNDIFIACVLTIIGYSINDTVVIYDRIRENTTLMKKAGLEDIVNTSINQTMSRSINTMMTTLICVVVLYVFSTMNNIGSLKDFSFSLLIGIVTGCYSTIFIASPLWVVWMKYKQRLMAKKALSN